MVALNVTGEEKIRAFPEAQGFGAFAAGGRDGQIVRVKTLKVTGPGSITEALNAKGPRIIEFDVGGVIDLDGRSLKITEPFLTISGETAPAPGITFIKGELSIATHDVVLRHIAVRTGEAGRAKQSGWESDAINTLGAWNVVVDHCSCTWGTDENLSASGPLFDGEGVEGWRNGASHHITFSHCIIAEGLANSTHSKGEHSKGTVINDNSTFISIIGNLFASNMQRNPITKGGVTAVIVNNWISNPGDLAIHNVLLTNEWGARVPIASQLVVEGNVLEYGPSTRPKLPLFYNHRNSPLEIYLADNLAFDREGKPAPVIAGSFTAVNTRPLWPDEMTPLRAARVKEYVARNAGARPWDRDPIDQRIVQAALGGKGKIIDSEQEVGGYPQRAAATAPVKPSR